MFNPAACQQPLAGLRIRASEMKSDWNAPRMKVVPPPPPPLLLWTLLSFAPRKPEDGTFNNSIVSTSEFCLFILSGLFARCQLFQHLFDFFQTNRQTADCRLSDYFVFFPLEADSLNTSSWVPKFSCCFCFEKKKILQVEKKTVTTFASPPQSCFLYLVLHSDKPHCYCRLQLGAGFYLGQN